MPCGCGSRVSCSLAPAAAVPQPEYNFKLACAPELRPSWELMLYTVLTIDYAARSAFEAKASARRGDSTAELTFGAAIETAAGRFPVEVRATRTSLRLSARALVSGEAGREGGSEGRGRAWTLGWGGGGRGLGGSAEGEAGEGAGRVVAHGSGSGVRSS